MVSDARRAVSVLADLAPSGESNAGARRNVTDRVLLPLSALRFLRMPASPETPAPLATGNHRRDVVDMVKRARLHGESADLRIGWLWLTLPRAKGGPQRIPLLSAGVDVTFPARDGVFLRTALSSISLARTGDIELIDLVKDEHQRESYESSSSFAEGPMAPTNDDTLSDAQLIAFPGVTKWAAEVADAAGFPGVRVVAAEADTIDEPIVVAQTALYLRETPRSSVSISKSLHDWARSDIEDTAFAALYGTDAVIDETAPSDEAVTSSIVLSPAQASVVQTARTAPVTVVSGPPGSGKTQTVAATALDIVERGGSVLVAAPSNAAVEALTTLLTDTPGPDPVVFGDSARRVEVADRLGQGGGELVDRRAVAAANEHYDRTLTGFHEQRQGVADVLEAEQHAEAADPIRTFGARQTAPAWFESTADHAVAERLLVKATETTGWFASIRRSRALAKLVANGRATTDDVQQLRTTLHTARSERIVEHLVATGGLDLDRSWRQLVELDEQRRNRLGRLRHAEAHDASRVDRKARATMGAVAAALRSGRARRRRRLATIDGAAMVEALPLWVGTLRDVEDLLPRTAGMFDLVIIDEASQVDQIQAAPALLRGRRAMIVGDPRQLRHVSFIADDQIAESIRKKGVVGADLTHRLDVRRMSTFDLGASGARTQMLDDHFRSTPHLIEFSARRFYEGRLHIATRHPANHSHDHITIRHTDGVRSDEGVNEQEVDAAIEFVAELEQRLRDGERVGSVGILTPSRAQADRIEEVALERFDLGVIDALQLRVGTVHGFQGCERDTTVISIGLDDDSPAGSRTFVANPHLFNVMVTRAREQVVVVTSISDDAGLIGDYLRHAGDAPPEPIGSPHADLTIDGLAHDLRQSGIPTITNYPAGRHRIDLVVGNGATAVGVMFGVHCDGAEAHIERELTLRRLGWNMMGVFASRWDDRTAELALELARMVRSQRSDDIADQR